MPGPTNPFRPPRPVNPFDNPSTTGLAVNPNGTYIANPFPTTSAIGNTGGFGAMLPQVNVGGGLFNPAPTPTPTIQYSSPIGPQPAPLPNNYPSAANRGMFNLNRTPTNTYAQSERGAQALPTNIRPGEYFQSEKGTPGVLPQMLPGLAERIAQNPAEYENLTPSQRDAIDGLLEVRGGGSGSPEGGGGGGGGSDFENTRFMQQYAAQGVGFLDQKRWDPQTKKFVSIGKLIKQGKLDIKTGRFNKRGNKQYQRRRGGGRPNPVQPTGPTETTSGFTGSYGVVNFNTATG